MLLEEKEILQKLCAMMLLTKCRASSPHHGEEEDPGQQELSHPKMMQVDRQSPCARILLMENPLLRHLTNEPQFW